MNEKNIKNSVFSGLLWKFGERITAQLVSFLVSVILARLLSPDDYGSVALVMVFITIANVFVSSGFGNALIQKKDVDNFDFSSVFYINIAVSILIYAVLFACAPFISEFYGMPILNPVLRVLGIRIIVASINSIQQAYVSRNMMFRKFFWSTLLGTVLSGVVGIIMAYNGFGVWALVAQYLTNTCVDTIVLWFTVKWRPILACSFDRAKPLIKYGWKLLVSGLLDTGYTQLRSLLIGKIYSSEDLAFYNQGDKYPQLIVVNINSSIGSVLFPAMSQFQNDKNKIKEITRRSIQICSYIMWPMMVGIAVVAESLIRLLLTDKWLPCVPFLRIFCFTYGLWPIHTANLQAINALGRSDLFLKLEIVKKTIGAAALIISVWFGPLAIALSLIITSLISTFINSFPNKKLLGYRYGDQMKDILPSFGLALFMGICVYFIGFLNLSDWAALIVQITVGAVVYLTSSKIFHIKSFEYLFNLLKGILISKSK